MAQPTLRTEGRSTMPEDQTEVAPVTEPVTEPAASEKEPAAETDWKAEARKWETRAKENAAKLKVAEPKLSEYDKLIEANKTELERAQEAAKTASEQISQYQSRAVKAEVKALAAATFADPEDAAAFLDLNGYVGADGDVDTAKIVADLADLLTRKPHLGVGPSRRVPSPNAAQGGGGYGGAPTLDDQMAAAVKNGDAREQIRIQNQKLAALAAR